MIDVDKAPIIVNQSDLKELIEERDNLSDQIALYNEVLKNVELFLTFWYEETTEFGKVRDAFNDLDNPPCKMVVDNGRVKIQLNNEEDSNSS